VPFTLQPFRHLKSLLYYTSREEYIGIRNHEDETGSNHVKPDFREEPLYQLIADPNHQAQCHEASGSERGFGPVHLTSSEAQERNISQYTSSLFSASASEVSFRLFVVFVI
jgi:hypothetical protein